MQTLVFMVGKDVHAKELHHPDLDPVNSIVVRHSKVVVSLPSNPSIDIVPVSHHQQEEVTNFGSKTMRSKSKNHLLVHVL